MSKALDLLDEISEHIGTCCAITMDPDDVQNLIDQLKVEIIKLGKSN
tara:strand:- start:715 stop:855 length:141 start_codon:yes stop_codon:yes gene_type:complete